MPQAKATAIKALELASLQSFAPSLKHVPAMTKSAADSKRMRALAEILQRPAK